MQIGMLTLVASWLTVIKALVYSRHNALFIVFNLRLQAWKLRSTISSRHHLNLSCPSKCFPWSTVLLVLQVNRWVTLGCVTFCGCACVRCCGRYRHTGKHVAGLLGHLACDVAPLSVAHSVDVVSLHIYAPCNWKYFSVIQCDHTSGMVYLPSTIPKAWTLDGQTRPGYSIPLCSLAGIPVGIDHPFLSS